MKAPKLEDFEFRMERSLNLDEVAALYLEAGWITEPVDKAALGAMLKGSFAVSAGIPERQARRNDACVFRWSQRCLHAGSCGFERASQAWNRTGDIGASGCLPERKRMRLGALRGGSRNRGVLCKDLR